MSLSPPLDISLLYRRHVAMVRARSLRILGSVAAAEDVAQEVFIRFLQDSGRRAVPEAPAAMLYRMATNAALNRLRDARRRDELDAQHLSPSGQGDPDPVDWIALRQVLAQVSEEEAQIATYFYFDGLEHEEIAALLSLQRRTVGRRLDSFRSRARALLEQAPEGAET